MHRRFRLLVALVAGLFAGHATANDDRGQGAPRPNFLIIVADDLGFSDLGAFGGEIETPNLDALARRGLRLTGFHAAPTCSPTRAMLMSGTDHHRAGLGAMAEAMAPNQRGKPGYEGYLRSDVASLAEIMAAGGYRTFFSGKWHLGLAPEQDPHARGFQHSFALLNGGHNHFGANVSADRTRGYAYTKDGATLSALPANFYSSDSFTNELIEAMKQSRAGADGNSPFFAYLAFTAPHWPLQAPAETVAKYRGRYDAGFEALRRQRLLRQIELGLLPSSDVPHEMTRQAGRWDSLSADQKRESARAMEVYAAMVDRMDQNVGRLVRELEASHQLDNTVILFLSDNGAEGNPAMEAMEPGVVHDNSLANMGAATSFVGYGPGWAEAATAPLWLYKAFVTEGGTRAPAFITWPALARQRQVTQVYANVMDILPTFVRLAGLRLPEGRFAGRVVQPVRGFDWAPFLAGRSERIYPADKPVGGELFGQRALRQGDWKVVDPGDGKWRLFDIGKDPGEVQDLSGAEPARTQAMITLWQAYADEVGVVTPPKPLLAP